MKANLSKNALKARNTGARSKDAIYQTFTRLAEGLNQCLGPWPENSLEL